MPIHRCKAKAAGGISQRLKFGDAVMRSLDKNDAITLSLRCLMMQQALSFIWYFVKLPMTLVATALFGFLKLVTECYLRIANLNRPKSNDLKAFTLCHEYVILTSYSRLKLHPQKRKLYAS
jgi:hypothetical protein